MKLKTALTLTTLSFLSVLAGSAMAATASPIVIAEAGNAVSKDQAAVIAEKASGGKVLSSETQNNDGKRIYLIKLLMADGLIKIVKVNAANGDIL